MRNLTDIDTLRMTCNFNAQSSRALIIHGWSNGLILYNMLQCTTVAFAFYTDRDECTEGNHTCFGENVVCVNTLGSFDCVCPDGYTWVDNRSYCEGQNNNSQCYL